MATYTKHTFSVISNLAPGTLTCHLYIDDSISPALTVPSEINILSIDPIQERIDLKAGMVEPESVSLEIAEDYSTYAAGFWWTLIETYRDYNFQIMLILTEDGTDTYLFRGSKFVENINWQEHYISGSTYVRSVSVQFVSPLLLLKNVSITDMINYLTNVVVGNGDYLIEGTCDVLEDTVKCVTLANLFNNMMEMAFGATDEGYQVVNRATDVMFWNGGTSEYVNPFAFYLRVQRYDTDFYVADLFDDESESTSWRARFDNCWELISAICLSLGIVPHYYYGDANGIYQGDANDKHTLEIMCRGDRTTTPITNTKILSSSVINESRLKSLNIKINNPSAVNSQMYIVYRGCFYTNDIENRDYNLELAHEFTSDKTESLSRTLFYSYTPGGGGLHFAPCIKAEYYNHTTGSMTVLTFSDGTNALLQLLAKYLFYRFSTGRREYTREYGDIKFTKSTTITHQNLKILARHEIDSVAYYAADVKKDILMNCATVKWVEE